ncbi:olfactory marker protein b isoform X1 [Esox lucius]|uniref:olfactory marker protein b isoform X1 n=1 Tax=Esox lucius TaxID=8010 RepID=UPI00147786E4|nr:olfactory marker protein b isoform X1 [Esox lucius]
MSAHSTLQLHFRPDPDLTEVMRQRVCSLQQRRGKRQDGERLLQDHEAVYRLDFTQQALRFAHWDVRLKHPGRITLTATSQLWTPDLTHLMNRQLLEPVGVFWRDEGEPDEMPVHHYEADAQEFGERIAEMAKVRKTMYFLLAFEQGVSPDTVECCISFLVDQN